jgi:hypothetical protein
MKPFRPNLAALLTALATIGVVCCSQGNAKQVTNATPDQTIERVARSVADGRFDIAWQALPPSYQKELTEIVHQGAAEMDAELWNRTFTVLQKTTRILRDKREFILDHPMLASSIENRGEAEAGWNSVVGLFDIVVHSDLADLNKVKRLDVGKFLGDTGQGLWNEVGQAAQLTPDNKFGEAMNDLRATDATVLSNSGETARVRIEVPGKPAKEEDYVQIEGRWIPAKLANDWNGMLDDARQKLAQLSGDEGQANRQAALMQLSLIESVLDNLQAAQTAEEFHAGLGAAMGAVAGTAMSMANTQAPTGTPYTTGE